MQTLKPFRETNPGVLEARQGGGLISIFGLPFLAAGVFVTLIGLGAVPLSNANEVPGWAYPVLVLMGVVFIVAGGTLVFGRTWTTIDRNRHLIIKRSGWLRPMNTRSLDLRDFYEIRLSFIPGDSDSADRFPVVLKAGMGANDLEIHSSIHYAEARQSAVFLAQFLKLPLTDSSTEHAQTLEVGSDQRILRPTPEPQTFPPQTMHSRVEEQAGLARIIIPGPGFRLAMLLEIAIPLSILAYVVPQVLVPFFNRTNTPEAVQYFFIGFLLFLFGFLPLLSFLHTVLKAMRSFTRITASREGLVMEFRGAIFTNRRTIPASEILGLDYSTSAGLMAAARDQAARRVRQHADDASGHSNTSVPAWVEKLARFARSKGVTIKAKSGLINFAAGLPDDEVCYLYKILQRALPSSRQG